MANAIFKVEERKEKKGTDDNLSSKTQHTSLMKEKDVMRNSMA
jgi:hypothetical protein